MKLKKLIFTLALAVTSGGAHAGDDGLVELMGSLQYFSHKLGLSIDAGNKKLAGFYAHEVEEVIETLEEIENYNGKPISKMVKIRLLPPFHQLEKAVKSGNTGAASGAFGDMVDACNGCHVATAHGYIKIQRSTTNPFMQSFE